jgi:carbonic anhydrase
MKLFAFCAALSASAFVLSHESRSTEASAPEGNSPLERLAAGNARFARGDTANVHRSLERRDEVAKGQHPIAVVVGCSDSRVPPELVFDQGLGDLFVVRCAGNVMGDAAIGSIEYAVEHFGCELVVVLGHERCGAVDAVLHGGDLPAHLSAFTPSILPVVEGAKKKGGDVLDNAVRANAARIARQLAECEPVLSEYSHLERLTIVGARYDLDTGLVEFFEPATPRRAPARTARTSSAR